MKKPNPKWTRAKKQMWNICNNKGNHLLDQYLWALKVFSGLVEHDKDDINAAIQVIKRCHKLSKIAGGRK